MDIASLFTNGSIVAINIAIQLGLLVIALKALGQIKEIREQNSLTRESIAIGELREFEKLVNKFEGFINDINITNKNRLELPNLEMQRFNLSESSESQFQVGLNNWNTFYKENNQLKIRATELANKLEITATALEYGVAKLDVIKDSIAPAFCGFVEMNAFIYINNRNSAISLFKNSINLYHKLKPLVKTRDQQIKLIKDEVGSILKKNIK